MFVGCFLLLLAKWFATVVQIQIHTYVLDEPPPEVSILAN